MNEKEGKSLHERIEKLEGEAGLNAKMVNRNHREMTRVYEIMTEMCDAINDINHRLRNVAKAARAIQKGIPVQLGKEEDNE